MTPEEAEHWLRQVEGKLFRTPPRNGRQNAWVAVVETPRNGGRRGRLIVALGGSMEEATDAAEHQWRAVIEGNGRPH